MLATSQIHSIPLRGPLPAVVPAGNDDGDLTSLSWLHKPGVLNSMCNALTGSPHRISTLGTRSARKPRDQRGGDRDGDDHQDELRPRRGSCNSTEKMLNVVLSVRNRRYNGEDVHKPPLSFACMIFMALESSPTKTLPVKQIYEWIQWKFPHYRTASPGWKNSVRHSLSLNKCFKKLEKLSRKTRSVVTKGGLWTVDPAYRESLLAALKLNPYHPYHKFFTAPYFPRSMIGALRAELELVVTDKDLDPAERDAALSMCLISGGDSGEGSLFALRAVYHDHNYTELPTPPSYPSSFSSHGLSLAEVAAAAELILGGVGEEEEEERGYKKRQRRKRKKGSVDEDYAYESDGGGESSDGEDEDSADDVECSLADSGYGGNSSPTLSHESRTSSLDDLCGANALLCLANNGSGSGDSAKYSTTAQ